MSIARLTRGGETIWTCVEVPAICSKCLKSDQTKCACPSQRWPKFINRNGNDGRACLLEIPKEFELEITERAEKGIPVLEEFFSRSLAPSTP